MFYNKFFNFYYIPTEKEINDRKKIDRQCDDGALR